MRTTKTTSPTSDAKVITLDGKAQPDQVVTEADVQEPPKLTKLLVQLLKDVTTLKRTPAPSRIDYEDVPVSTAGALVPLQHNFGGRVRWWLVGWSSAGTSAPILRESSLAGSLSTTSTLILQSYVAGTATIRIEKV